MILPNDEPQEFEISITKPEKDFQRHLGIENNSRIIFSGIFGIGKTHFLKEFFKKKEAEYNLFHLFPVNYSVASNEDVFRLIKHDVFYELLKFPEVFDQQTVNKFLAANYFLKNNASDVLALFVKAIPGIGKQMLEVLKSVKDLNDKFGNYKEELEVDELKNIREYVQGIENEEGSIYESDFHTEIIKTGLGKLKDKKNVLVLDDLDRIDPDHLFRILNVFSAHFDSDDETNNKFGFDHIVMVLDWNNTEVIFKNRYGEGVDFMGYMDKFLSDSVFEYFNLKSILTHLVEIFESIVTNKGTDLFFEHRNILGEYVSFIVSVLIRKRQLNVRALKKVYGIEYYGNYNYDYSEESRSWMHDIFDFLAKLVGSSTTLLKYLEEFAAEDFRHWNEANLYGAEILLGHHFRNKSDAASPNSYYLGQDKTSIPFHVTRVGDRVQVDIIRGDYSKISKEDHHILFGNVVNELMVAYGLKSKD